MRQLCHWQGPTIALALAVGLTAGAQSLTTSKAEAPFLAESSAAMETMMSDMDIKPTGEVNSTEFAGEPKIHGHSPS